MKYVNHMSSSVEDEKHEALIDKCGLQGYGAYWIIAEKISSQIRPECVSTSLTLSWRNWARHLRVSTKTAQFLIRSMNVARLIFVTESGDLVKVDMPNLLKYADEYTRKLLTKSRQTPEKLPTDPGFPAVPAVPDKQDLRPVADAPTIPRQKSKAICQWIDCIKPGTISHGGRWYCGKHHELVDKDPVVGVQAH